MARRFDNYGFETEPTESEYSDDESVDSFVTEVSADTDGQEDFEPPLIDLTEDSDDSSIDGDDEGCQADDEFDSSDEDDEEEELGEIIDDFSRMDPEDPWHPHHPLDYYGLTYLRFVKDIVIPRLDPLTWYDGSCRFWFRQALGQDKGMFFVDSEGRFTQALHGTLLRVHFGLL